MPRYRLTGAPTAQRRLYSADKIAVLRALLGAFNVVVTLLQVAEVVLLLFCLGLSSARPGHDLAGRTITGAVGAGVVGCGDSGVTGDVEVVETVFPPQSLGQPSYGVGTAGGRGGGCLLASVAIRAEAVNDVLCLR